MFADIYINLPVKSIADAFTYSIPHDMTWIQRGCRVIVPFGSRLIEGFVVNVHEKIPSNMEVNKIKAIHSTLDEEPWFTDKMYETAKWMKNYYLCSLGECMRLFIPGKNSVKISSSYNLNRDNIVGDFSEEEIKIIELFKEKKDLSYLDIQKELKKQENLTYLLSSLVGRKVLKWETKIQLREKKLYEKLYKFNANFWFDVELKEKKAIEAIFSQTLKKYPAQYRAIKYFYATKDNSYTLKELNNLNISYNIIKILLEKKYIEESLHQIKRNSYRINDEGEVKNIVLTYEQNKVIEKISRINEHKVFLLFGVTGSGKTQIYIELAKKLTKEKQMLILVPEIVLTGQLVKSLQEYFFNEVAVIHSKLSISERHDTFNRIRSNQAKIIIGARSALFAPFVDLETIILDEEHDASYKQDEAPRYHGRDIAIAMGEIYKAKVILASATPSIESYYNALNGDYELLEMKKRVDNRPFPKIQTVDMRNELHYGNKKILSYALQKLIDETIKAKQQIIIMLNRRGYYTFVMCRNCGYVVKCKECQMPMVYHRRGTLQCHHCDIYTEVPKVCPECGSKYIKFFGSGTEKLEQELETLFPTAKILRLDRDTTSKKFAHQEILEKFKNGGYDILLGTQMVAKGHDIPNVTAVGIISADSSVNMPEFRSGERCFSLITQTAGRAGRGILPGKVIVQAYSLDNYAIKWGVKQDYVGFYNEEISNRKELFYPPYAFLIKLTCCSEIEEDAYNLASQIKVEFNKYFKNTTDKLEIMGPAPAIMGYLRGKYRVNLLLKAVNISLLQDFIIKMNLQLNNKVIIDVNPINTN